jgi:hypothetical protein
MFASAFVSVFVCRYLCVCQQTACSIPAKVAKYVYSRPAKVAKSASNGKFMLEAGNRHFLIV